jgi:hypothetical protein
MKIDYNFEKQSPSIKIFAESEGDLAHILKTFEQLGVALSGNRGTLDHVRFSLPAAPQPIVIQQPIIAPYAPFIEPTGGNTSLTSPGNFDDMTVYNNNSPSVTVTETVQSAQPEKPEPEQKPKTVKINRRLRRDITVPADQVAP